jgi:hypothetical protein
MEAQAYVRMADMAQELGNLSRKNHELAMKLGDPNYLEGAEMLAQLLTQLVNTGKIPDSLKQESHEQSEATMKDWRDGAYLSLSKLKACVEEKAASPAHITFAKEVIHGIELYGQESIYHLCLGTTLTRALLKDMFFTIYSIKSNLEYLPRNKDIGSKGVEAIRLGLDEFAALAKREKN